MGLKARRQEHPSGRRSGNMLILHLHVYILKFNRQKSKTISLVVNCDGEWDDIDRSRRCRQACLEDREEETFLLMD